MTTDCVVTLPEVTRDGFRAILALEFAPEQRRLVTTIAESIAQAHFEKGAWFRAIEADGRPVGFVMPFDPTLPGPIGEGTNVSGEVEIAYAL